MSSTVYVVAVDSVMTYTGTGGYFNRARTRGRILAPIGAGVYGQPKSYPNQVENTYNYYVDGTEEVIGVPATGRQRSDRPRY